WRAPDADRRLRRRVAAQQKRLQRFVDLQAAVVLNEALLPELIHEVTHARAGRPHHLRQRALVNAYDGVRSLGVLAEIRKLQQQTRQPLLAGMNELLGETVFDAADPEQQVRDEHSSECRVRQ